MKTRNYLMGIAGVLGLAIASSASAGVIGAGYFCTTGTAKPDSGPIALGNVTVTGTTTDATECYGAFLGNDNFDSIEVYDPDASSLDTVVLDFLAKYNVGTGTTADSAFALTASGGTTTGTFSFGGPVAFEGLWGVSFKAGACWGAWTFSGGTYTGGSFTSVFGSGSGGNPNPDFQQCKEGTGSAGLSHISVWGELGTTTEVPEPTTLALLGLGLLGFGVARRRMAAR